jgi:glycosyltransferase involved in cell wall biosynthesis
MKILHVITSLTTGGAEKLVTDIVPKLSDSSHDVRVLLFDGKETPFKKKLESQGIVVNSFGVAVNVYNPLFILRLIPIIRKYDIIHTHNTACQFYVAIAKFLSHARCKLVTTEHSTENRRRYIWWFKPIDKWVYHHYDAIISISQIATNSLVKYIGTGYKLITIPNGVDISALTGAAPYNNLRNDNDVILIMVAAFRVGKDQDTVIKAIKRLPDNYKLWLVGDGVRRSEIERLIDDLNLKERVKLWGVRTDVPQLLKTADIIVMSSRYEGLSLSSIEGMAVNKPFIASDVKGLHETTVNAGILFPYQDVDALINEILRLENDKGYCKDVSEKCLVRAKEYELAKTIDGYRKVYKSLIN